MQQQPSTTVKKIDYLTKPTTSRLSDLSYPSKLSTQQQTMQNGKVRFAEEVIVNEFSCRSSTDVSKEVSADDPS